MTNSVKDMTEGSPLTLIFFFSLPLMVGNVFQQLYTTIDSIIVGQGVGMTALAALGASDWIYWMILWGIHGLTQGFGVLIAQAFGFGDRQRLRELLCSITLLTVLFSVLLTLIPFAATMPVLRLLHTPPAIIAQAGFYLHILFSGNTIVIAFNTASSVLRSLGNSKLPLIAMVVAACTNICLDLLFVMHFHFGIAGAAAATLLAQALAFFICLFGLSRIRIIHPTRADWLACPKHFSLICRLSIPLSLQNAIIAVGGMFVQTVLNSLGVSFITAVTAANKINGILESVAASFGYGLGTFIAQNHGAGKISRLNQGIRAAVLLSAVSSLSISLACAVAGKHIIRLFLSASEENYETVLTLSYQYLLILCSCLFILFLVHLYRNALQSLGTASGPVLSGIAEFVMRAAGATIFPIVFGETGIFYCEISAWIGAAIILIIAYYRRFTTLKTGK